MFTKNLKTFVQGFEHVAFLRSVLGISTVWNLGGGCSSSSSRHGCCCSSVTKSCLTLCDPWTLAHQASLSPTISWSLLRFMSIELVMLSHHLTLHCPLLLLPSVLPSIRVFSNESTLRMKRPKYWSFSFSIRPSNEYSGSTPHGCPGASFKWHGFSQGLAPQ